MTQRMECLDETTVTLFLDRRLPAPQVSKVEGHIDECPSCRKLLSALAHGRSSVPQANRATIPDGQPSGMHPLPVGDRIDRYVLLRVMGSGGMGTVYAAYDPALDRKVALKLLHRGSTSHPESRARLVREAQAMARVSSPNVVAVYDVASFNEQVYVSMELVGGGTLRTWLREGPRSWHEILYVFEAAGRGIAAAHAEGIVHRDFKPDNVLIDGDRIRVADFGLAAPSSEAITERDLPASTSVDQSITITGAIVGTPAYMAPEQLSGQQNDVRSDQFSFCVALYEGLYGSRPFGGETIAELSREVRAGRVRTPARSGPAWLRAAVIRGLAVDPDARFPSMDALLAELARHRPRARVGWAIAGLVIAIGAATVLGVRSANRGPAPCEGLEAPPADYDPRIIRSAFIGVPDGPATGAHLISTLDAWRSRAGAMRLKSCRATRVDGVESPELLDLRIECIADTARRVSALAIAFARPTPELVENATAAVDAATDLSLCQSRRALLEPLRPPQAPQLRTLYEALRIQLAAVYAANAAGRFAAAAAEGEQVAHGAAHDAFHEIESKAWHEMARALREAQQVVAARESLQRALVAAEAAGDDHERAALYVALGLVESDLDRGADAQRWTAQARALVEHLGDETLRWQVFYAEGSVAVRVGDVTTGIAHFRAALTAHGDLEDLVTADLLHSLGAALGVSGQSSEAERVLKRSIAMRERISGARSPTLIDSLDALGSVLCTVEKTDEGIAALERAFSIAETANGRSAALLPRTAIALGTVLTSIGRSKESLALLDRARVPTERGFGANSTVYALVLQARAVTLTDLGRFDEAITDGQQSVDITRKAGPASQDLTTALEVVGRTQTARGKHDDAIRSFTEALHIHTSVEGADTFNDEVLLGDNYLALGRPAEALPHLERAIVLRSDGQAYAPTDLAGAQVSTARALLALHRDRSRVVSLLRAARDVFAANSSAGEELKEASGLLSHVGVPAGTSH